MEVQGGGQRRGDIAWRAVFAVALVVLVASLASLGAIAFSYYQGQSKYSELAAESGFDPEDAEGGRLADIGVDWHALLEANADTVGWLYIPNTSINYPVVKGADNEYYLTHDFDGEAGWLANYGAVFMDYRNNADWSDQSYFIFGHHMNDGSMFSDLAGFTEQARFDECRAVYLLSPLGHFKLRTFSLAHVDADDAIVQASFGSSGQMASYVQAAIDSSVVDPGSIPPSDAIPKTFAFATCDNEREDGRYVLYAYVEEDAAEGLSGHVGLSESDGQVTGFEDDLGVESR